MTHKSPLVSVVISTYRRNELLLRCIRAILLNEHVGEVIVVHDGPSVEYLTLAGTLSADPYFDCVKFEYTTSWAGRPAPARNYGIKLAKFSFIAFCDDDDTWESGHLASSIDILLSHDEADLVFLNPSMHPSTEKVSLNNLFSFNFLWQSSCVVRLGPEIGKVFFYNESLSHKAIEDYMLWIRLIVRGFHIVYFNRPTVVYAVSSDSIRSPTIKTNLKIIRAFFVDYRFHAILMIARWIAFRAVYLILSRLAIGLGRILHIGF
jgi:glycosyltransferase involved in cell wall biosynthesis